MMLEIIDEIKVAVKETGSCKQESLSEVLNAKDISIWSKDYPVAVVHHKKRIKEQNIVALFDDKALLDEEGITPSSYSPEDIAYISLEAPKYIKLVDLMCMKEKEKFPMAFAPKRPNDYWKKVINSDHLNAMVELSRYESGTSICEMEAELRDIIRRLKEVPALKQIGLVWVASVPKEEKVDKLLKQYFLDNYTMIEVEEMKCYIGWSPTLDEINMRYFVCPPN